MKCTKIQTREFSAIVCSSGRGRRRRCACGAEAPLLCDWIIARKPRMQTCNAPICAACAEHVGPDKHLCATHKAQWRTHPKNPHREAST